MFCISNLDLHIEEDRKQPEFLDYEIFISMIIEKKDLIKWINCRAGI